MNAKKVLAIAIITTVISRLAQLILYYTSDNGSSSLWDNWFLNTFDHYQIGILILLLSLNLNKRRLVLFAIGIGLIIDELNSMANLLFPILVPYRFNSWLDYGFILTGYIIFGVIVRRNLLKSINK